MPTTTELTELQQIRLMTGFEFPPRAFDSDADELAAWRRHASTLIPEYIREHGLWRRPWAWWRFEAPEPRRVLSDPEHLIIPDGAFYLGMAAHYRGQPDAVRGPWFESTHSYLVRLDLPLTEGERQARDSEDEFPNGVVPGEES